MGMVYKTMADLIGGTPLLELTHIEQEAKLKATLLAKLEYCNPTGSVKDRTAKAMLDEAEKQGVLETGAVIIEPTSGNTGISLAAICAVRGYKLVLVMPDTMSMERRQIARAYGADIVLTEGSRGMEGAVARAEELAAITPGAFMPRQFNNPANPAIHRETTGPEIWRDTDGAVDILVAGVGTGGTLTGTGEYLKAQKPAIKVVAVEPESSAVLSKGKSGPHKIQGIGAGFIPETLNTEIYDEVIAVASNDAYNAGRRLARKEGILAGISAGAALWAAVSVAERPENRGRTIVVILPDTGERYLSTELFAE